VVRGRLNPLPLLGLAAGCALAVAGTYALLVRTNRGQRIDQGAFDGRALATTTAHDAAQQLLTTISVGTLALAILVLVAQALLRGRVALALVAGTAIGGSVVTTQVLKRVLERPDLLLDGRLYENSFPSGHVTIAFAVGVAATLVAPVRARRLVSVLAVAYGSAVGIAVVAAGWHRPSDVAGALFVVMAWAAVAGLADALLERRRAVAQSWPQAGVARTYLVLGGALIAAGYAVTLAIVAAGRAGAIEWTAVNGAFAGACVAVAGLAALLMAALLAALRATVPTRTRVPARRARARPSATPRRAAR
jgi:membrane-associated phospholipid phosphatase